jgi:hypothetical protein
MTAGRYVVQILQMPVGPHPPPEPEDLPVLVGQGEEAVNQAQELFPILRQFAVQILEKIQDMIADDLGAIPSRLEIISRIPGGSTRRPGDGIPLPDLGGQRRPGDD